MTFLQLFWEFFKTGLFAIGGGMATVPFLQDIAVKTGWYNAGDLANMIAVSESTPGPLGVNMATYVGYTVGGTVGGVGSSLLGALIATLGLITPSIIVILVVAYFLDKFRSSKIVNNTLYGLRPASVALITAAGIDIMLYALFQVNSIQEIAQMQISIKGLILFVAVLVCTRWVPKLKKLHPVWFIAASAVVGIVLQMGV
jgi:chromate transporter